MILFGEFIRRLVPKLFSDDSLRLRVKENPVYFKSEDHIKISV